MKIDIIDLNHHLYNGELDLRFRVLREPLGMTRAQVPFPKEDEFIHFVLTDGTDVHGCVLFHRESAVSGRLLQMAVDPSQQGNGLGGKLVSKLETYVEGLGITTVTLHSREIAAGFYSSLGYERFGEPFTEVGINHLMMRKDLKNRK